MNNSFTAIDFETAQGKRWSICQVGLMRVENGVITEQLSLLVQPQIITIGIILLQFTALPLNKPHMLPPST